ncbi:MAG: hypothetical protein EOO75_09975 [Myxococcales bacterium]|nr:MAG: hypothetical protein EOO75_09975 [Myxococcales bacterium]
MIRPRSLLALRLACLVAIGVSVALLIDSLRPMPAFCVTGSGCDQIRRLGYGKIAGVPVAGLGLGAFGGLFTLTFFPAARQMTGLAAMAGGVVGLGLIAAQAFILHLFCKLCLVVDVSAIAAAVAGYFLFHSSGVGERDDGQLMWAGALTAALGLPWALAASTPPGGPVPAAVRSLWKADHVNVVEFSDFECPYCRLAHPRIEAARQAVPGARVNLVRRTLPLPMHPHARDASRAWLCAVEQGKGDAMADHLFSGDLTTAAIDEHAQQSALDLDAFHRCLQGTAIDDTLASHIALVRGADFKGLPAVWVNERLLLGASDESVYIEALRQAAAGQTGSGTPTWPVPVVLVVSLVLAGLGWRAGRAAPAPDA